MDCRKEKCLAKNTGLHYEELIALYIEPKLGKMKLKDLNLRVINQFYQSLKDEGNEISSIGYTHRVLHSALEQAVKNGILRRNPAHGATVPKIEAQGNRRYSTNSRWDNFWWRLAIPDIRTCII